MITGKGFAFIVLLCLVPGVPYAGIKEYRDLVRKTNKTPAEYAELIKESNVVISDETFSETERAWAMYHKAMSLWGLNRIDEAQNLLHSIVDTYPSQATNCAAAFRGIASLYLIQGKPELSQTCYYIILTFYPRETLYVSYAFRRIEKTYFQPGEYKKILEKLLASTPDTAENSEFVLKLRSELKKN